MLGGLGGLCSSLLRVVPASTSLQLSRNVKQKVKVRFVRPRWPGACHPLVSGDRAPAQIPSLASPRLDLTQLPEYKEFPDEFKPLLSYGSYTKVLAKEAYIKEFEDRVRRHPFDTKSDEVKLARFTARIRILQNFIKEHPRETRAKVSCKIMIDRRNAALANLRSKDYRLYEYVLEKLDLQYKPVPAPENNRRAEKRRSIVKLVEMRCDEIRQNKMDEYKQQLIAERERLLKEYAENPI